MFYRTNTGNMDRDITDVFEQFILEYTSLEDADNAFFDRLAGDEPLRDEYREWCSATGYSERKGFAGFYHDYFDRHDAIWDSIFPNNEEYDEEYGKA